MIVDIDLERCTGCGLCDPICPSDVIHMELIIERVIPVIKYVEHCVTCFNCEIFCPEQCIDVHPIVRRRPLPW
jgi:Pyruvate/2-oxoacid:ferredoxin oxidoreductase delta subunit